MLGFTYRAGRRSSVGAFMKRATLLLLPLAVGCVIASSHSEVHSNASASVIIHGSASLSPGVSVVVVRCDPSGSAFVDVKGEITASAASTIQVSASACGSVHEGLTEVSASDFTTVSGSQKASYSAPMQLRLGTHGVVLCFTQSDGAQSGTYVCSEQFDLDVVCPEADPDGGTSLPEGPSTQPASPTAPLDSQRSCGDETLFGELVGNPSLCSGGASVHIAVQARGAFGEAPKLTISGPNAYSHQAQLRHSGKSCNYVYNWSTEGNGGAGEYSFKIEGAGRALTFVKTLDCP